MRKLLITLCLLFSQVYACAPRMISPGSPTESIAGENPTISTLPADVEKIEQRGELVIGTAVTEPFVYHHSQTDELVGFDIEIAQYIAARMGMRLNWIELPFASLIPALQDNRVDMVIAAMYITPEREQVVDFSNSYADTGLIMAVRPELGSEIKSIEALANRTVGVKLGATGEEFAEQLVNEGVPLKIERYRDTVESLLNLEVGRIDVVFNDYLNTMYFIKKNRANILIATDAEGKVIFLSRAQLGIAVHKGNLSLLEAINQSLADMHSDGTYEKLFQHYLAPEILPATEIP